MAHFEQFPPNPGSAAAGTLLGRAWSRNAPMPRSSPSLPPPPSAPRRCAGDASRGAEGSERPPASVQERIDAFFDGVESFLDVDPAEQRSEERRVGKERRSRG